MTKPRFSVIIPTLNEEKFLPKLLASLTRQTEKDFEVIVVDGKSKDHTVAEAKKFVRSLPLRIIVTNRTGVSHQRNFGAAEASTNWLIFVDADSILLPNFIERVGKYIERKHAKFFTTWLKADTDDASDAILGFLMNMSVEGSIVIEHPWAPGPLTIVRRDVFESVGGYNEKVTYGEDHELSVMIYRSGIPFEILREVLYIYSFRRYRTENQLKIFDRTLKSTLSVIFTHRGLTSMPGFISGGSLYEKSSQEKKKGPLLLKKLESSARKLIEDFLTE